MFLRVLLAFWLIVLPVHAGTLPLLGAGGPPPATGDTPFTQLSTHYMRTGGSDANCNGTVNVDDSVGVRPNCAWSTSVHNLNCGDAVIVAPSLSYTSTHFPGGFGTQSNCPSTTGGIDGAGGINHAIFICGGSDLEACLITLSGDFTDSDPGESNLAFEGFKVNANGHRFLAPKNCQHTGSPSHHWASINNVVYNAAQAAGMNDCGDALAESIDYWAIVGTVAQNAAQDSICLAAIDGVGPKNLNTTAGTHLYMYGNFSYANANVGCRATSDTEAYMFDTLDFHNYTQQGVIANNVAWASDRMCIQLFWQQNNADTPTIKVYNNTCFHNNQQTGTDNYDGEININTGANYPWITTVQNNIAYQSLATSGGGHNVSAFAVYGTANNLTVGGTGNENVFRANNGSCGATFCNSGFDAGSFGTSGELGTNTYTNPTFNNTSDLLTNWVGTPSCTGFVNVTQCMGYAAATATLTSNTPISDLTATCAGCTGKGYQLPSTTCNSNADFPTWLKGVVYLHVVSGSTIVQKHDLVTTPCGL